jgi:diguanylate cyclase (GGDEF)-like protein
VSPHPLSRLYVLAVSVAGLTLLVALAASANAIPGDELVACGCLSLGVLFGELFPVSTGNETGTVAFSSTFTFALLLGWGPDLAAPVQAGACIIAALAHRTSWWKTAFNVGMYVLAVGAATVVLALLHGHPGLRDFGDERLIIALAGGAAFFTVNSGLVAAVVALHGGQPFVKQLMDELRLQTGTEGILLGMAPLALVGALASPALLLLIGMPLLAVQRAGRQALANEELALRDPLTGLANRVLLTDRAEQALARVRREGGVAAVLLIDLDRFKEINDSLGHHVGDRILCEVATRIRGALREIDTVARLGGDEFAVLLPDLDSSGEAIVTARRVASAIARPFEIADIVLEPSGSVGVACAPTDARDVETLMRHADAAMYEAKAGHTPVAAYTSGEEDFKLTQLKLAGRLGPAIAEGEVQLVYQPQVRPETGEMVGVEALARWHHPQLGVLPPNSFVPLAERSGHILALTTRVLDDATAQLARWDAEGLELRMAVNLSARSLMDPDLPHLVRTACRRAGVEPTRLVLEITEGMLLDQPERAIAVAEELADLGAAISVDDFGTGFSSLVQLVRLPAAELKIDRSFVVRMEEDERSAAIVSCIADLGRSLGLRVVAEGVETHTAREAVTALGCDLAQGYLWAAPMGGDAIPGFVSDLTRLGGGRFDGRDRVS